MSEPMATQHPSQPQPRLSSGAEETLSQNGESSKWRWQATDASGNPLGFVEADNWEAAKQLASERFPEFDQLGDCEKQQNGHWSPSTYPTG